MSRWRVIAALAVFFCSASAAVLFLMAEDQAATVARCPAGLSAAGPACCGMGQVLRGGRCDGEAQSCASTQTLRDGRCIPVSDRLQVKQTRLRITVSDWDLEGQPTPSNTVVEAFSMSRTEVTHDEWSECVEAGQCRVLGHAQPELPVVGVDPAEAAHYCQFRGGSLPTSAQWLAAAMGEESRRYPWGPFGLVCRRAAFGLAEGPCGWGGVSPEIPGSRPDGATPEGVLDLSGNVAEWTLDQTSDGRTVVRARGGSFRSTVAAELKSLGAIDSTEPQDDVGFRCVWVP